MASHSLGSVVVVGGGGAGAGAGAGVALVGPVPRSAKRWARSAHLHEVRRGARDAEVRVQVPLVSRGVDADVGSEGDDENEHEAAAHAFDVADGVKRGAGYVPRSAGLHARRRGSPLRERAVNGAGAGAAGAGETGGDGWVDTDADGSDVDWARGHLGEVEVVEL